MFLFLQSLFVAILLAAAIIFFGRIKHKSRAFIAGFCVVLCISAIISGVILNAIPMPTEQVLIEASGGNEIALKGVIVDGKEYPIEEPVKGTWFYSKSDGAYLWLNEGDERLTEPLTRAISVEVPVGAGRRLLFPCGEQKGIVTVSYSGESKTYDLYGNTDTVKEISVPDSNRIYDDFVKLCRLGGYGLMILCMLGLALLLAEKTEKETQVKLICGTLSIVSTVTFYLNTGLIDRSGHDLYALVLDFSRSFSAGNYVLGIILAPMLYKTYMHCAAIYRRKFSTMKGAICIAAPAGFLAAFMIIGNAFISNNTLRPIFENELQFAKSLFGVIGYFSIFFFVITWIFDWLDRVDICEASAKKWIKPIQMYFDCVQRWPFRTAFITLAIVYVPLLIISYPGLLMMDSAYQFHLVYGRIDFNNANPIIHTLFISLCMKIGQILFSSSNGGVFVYSVLQFLIVMTTISLLVKLLMRLHVSAKVSAAMIIYYAIHPRIQSYMFLMTKDILDSVFLLVFIAAFYIFHSKKHSGYIYIILGLSDLGALLFRHDSVYIIAISLIIAFFLIQDFKKQILVIAACTLGFSFLWNNVVLPGLNIPLGYPDRKDTGVLSSIMLQQTARYIRDAGDEVTEEERAIISACLDYDNIVASYQPDNLSDGVAGRLKHSTMTQDDWKAYQRTWFKMFFKHPEIYIEATLNHKYKYFYPQSPDYYSYSWSKHSMDWVNGYKMEKMPTEFSYPEKFSDVKFQYELLRESFFKIPMVNILFTTSSHLWALIIWFAYCICRKQKVAVAIMMPLLVLVLVLMAGPSNGSYFRYTYPYVLCLPFVIILGLLSRGQADSSM